MPSALWRERNSVGTATELMSMHTGELVTWGQIEECRESGLNPITELHRHVPVTWESRVFLGPQVPPVVSPAAHMVVTHCLHTQFPHKARGSREATQPGTVMSSSVPPCVPVLRGPGCPKDKNPRPPLLSTSTWCPLCPSNSHAHPTTAPLQEPPSLGMRASGFAKRSVPPYHFRSRRNPKASRTRASLKPHLLPQTASFLHRKQMPSRESS